MLVGVLRAGDDRLVPDAPAGDGLGQGDRRVSTLHISTELDPGVAQGRAMKVHPPAATDDGGTRLLVHAVEVDEPDSGRLADRDLRRADLQGRLRVAILGRFEMGIALEPFFGSRLTGLDLHQADAEERVLVRVERERPTDEHGAKGPIGIAAVDDAVPRTNEDGLPRGRDLAAGPGLG